MGITEDRSLIAALRDPQHPGHTAAWSELSTMVERFLYSRNQATLPDQSISSEDITQEILFAISGKLSTFAYRSQFSTWVFAICQRVVLRLLRSSLARKRSAPRTSLDTLSAHVAEPIAPDEDGPETIVAYTLITERIRAVLARNPDPRLNRIFFLWHDEDLTLGEIGRQIGVSQPRISGLRKQIIEMLRRDPELRVWGNDFGSAS